MGLFSERRFLIFTKRGPIEISFKLSHYIGLALTVVVGFSSIVYYSLWVFHLQLTLRKKI